MININYKIKECDGVLVLVSQTTGARLYKIVGVDPIVNKLELKHFEIVGVHPTVNKLKLIPFMLEFSRVDDLNIDLLTEYFPEKFL